MTLSTRIAVASGIALAASAAAAQTTNLAWDEVASGVNVEACVNAGAGPICENGSSGLMGTISITVDDPANPTTISIVGFSGQNTAPITLLYDFGFFGSVTVNANVFSVSYNGFAPTTPVAIVGGAFTVPMVPVLGTIEGDFSGSGIIGGTVGSGTLNESAQDMPDLTGTLAVDPVTGDYTLTLDFALTQTGDVGGLPTTIDGVGTIVARGPAPEEDECLADVNGDGSLTGADFNAFITAFVAGDPRADQNQDGNLTGADFNAFISGFSAGCP